MPKDSYRKRLYNWDCNQQIIYFLLTSNFKADSLITHVGANIFSVWCLYCLLLGSLLHRLHLLCSSVYIQEFRQSISSQLWCLWTASVLNHISDHSQLVGRAPELQTTGKDMASHPGSYLQLIHSNCSCNLPQAGSQDWKLEKQLFSTITNKHSPTRSAVGSSTCFRVNNPNKHIYLLIIALFITKQNQWKLKLWNIY